MLGGLMFCGYSCTIRKAEKAEKRKMALLIVFCYNYIYFTICPCFSSGTRTWQGDRDGLGQENK
jgi:hypothetical protein